MRNGAKSPEEVASEKKWERMRIGKVVAPVYADYYSCAVCQNGREFSVQGGFNQHVWINHSEVYAGGRCKVCKAYLIKTGGLEHCSNKSCKTNSKII